jgi:hypothetical protein
MSAVSALEALQLQRLERWSSLLLRTFANMMAEHATRTAASADPGAPTPPAGRT